jgi:hypothetical protein
MKIEGLISGLALIALGTVIIRYRKCPYWIFGKIYFVEGNVAVFFGFILIVLGFLSYYATVENLRITV